MKESRKQSNQLELFAVASLDGDFASHSASPGSKEAKQMTVISGQKWLGLLKSSNPLSSLVRMFLESSKWGSTKRFLIWKVSVTPQQRLVFRLVPSMPRTLGKEYSLLPTPNAMAVLNMWKSAEYLFHGKTERESGAKIGSCLSWTLAKWHLQNGNQKDNSLVPDPCLYETIMDFPLNWTDLNA